MMQMIIMALKMYLYDRLLEGLRISELIGKKLDYQVYA